MGRKKSTSGITRSSLRNLVIMALFVCLVPALALAIPNTMNIQGKLTDSSNALITSTTNVTARIYDSYTGGNQLYESNNTVTPDARGIFSVTLQNVNLPFSSQYYLGIKVNGDSEMSPRINLTSSPYSFASNRSSALNTSQDVLIGNTINLTSLGNIYANGTISSANVLARNQIDVGGGFANGGLTIQSDGNIVTQGDVVFSGNITILNISNLNINGSLFPPIDNLFSIGNGSLRWRSVNVSGTVQAQALETNALILGWANLTNYPAACSPGEFMTAIGDSITCQAPGATSSAAGGWANSSTDTATSLNVVVEFGTFLINTTSNRIGINQASPNVTLGVSGDTNITGILYAGALNITTNARIGSLVSCTAIETDTQGNFICGSDDTGAGSIFNRENVSEYLGGSSVNASIIKTNNITGWDLNVNDEFTLSNLTGFLGGSNETVVRFSNISSYDTNTADEFNYANLTAIIGDNASILRAANLSTFDGSIADDFNLANLTGFLGGSNETLVRFNNLSGYDTSVLDDFSANNFSNSSHVNITIVNGKVRVDLNISQALCIALTGSSALCDGDDGGAGGSVTGTGNTGNISYWSGANTLGNSTLFQSNGLIGIGTTSPSKQLVVIGSVNISDALNVSGTVQAARFVGDGSTLSNVDTSFTDDFNYANLTAIIGDNASILRAANLSTFDGSIADDFNLANLTGFLGGSNETLVRFNNLSGYDTSTADEFTKANYSSEYASSGFDRENVSEYLGGDSINASLIKSSNLSTILSPYQYEASAFKNANATALIGNNESNSLWNRSGSNIFLREITNNVGMGTNSPGAALHILKNDTNNFSTTNVLVLEHSLANPLNSTGGLGVGVLFRGIDNGSNTDDIALINATLVGALNGSESSSLGFYTRSTGNALSLAMILNGSNVGIGTSSPDKKLVVIGSVNISDALNVSGTVQAARFIGDGSTLSNIDASVADEFNRANVSDYLGGSDINASLIKVANTTGWDFGVADDFSALNFTNSSHINITIVNGKVRVDLNISQALCVALTGSAALCDADDSGGAGAVTGNGNTGNITYWTGSSTVGNSTLYQSNGLIGIGTLGPDSTLHINGSGPKGGFRVTNDSGYTALFVNSSNGNIGVGKSNPTYGLEVNATARIIRTSTEVRVEDTNVMILI